MLNTICIKEPINKFEDNLLSDHVIKPNLLGINNIKKFDHFNVGSTIPKHDNNVSQTQLMVQVNEKLNKFIVYEGNNNVGFYCDAHCKIFG